MEEVADDLGVVAQLAKSIGASEAALRLLISLLTGYPLAFFYRSFLYGKHANIQHLYFTVCGLVMCYFNFGGDTIHSLANVILIYLLLLICGGTSLSVGLAFIINVGYLLWCYYETMVGDYSVTWSMPQCVLTLRLTGLAMDVYDGSQKEEKLSAEQKETALRKSPSFLEIAGHTYFFGGFLVGPQFPMKRYQDLVSGAFSDPVTKELPESVVPALRRLVAGAVYTFVFQISAILLLDSYLVSDNFMELSFISKCLIIALWGKLTLCKYVGCWLITEGVCIITGLTYNGRDENGNHLWNACANIHIRSFELAKCGQDYIGSFNVNTNRWMGKYIFKRLKWLGNKNLSQGLTLFFLALWHGLHSGYYVNFFFEFVMIHFERGVEPILNESRIVKFLRKQPPVGPLLIWLFCKLYVQIFLGYALVSFSLFTADRYLPVYASVYFFPHIIVLGWPLIQPFLKPSKRSKKAD